LSATGSASITTTAAATGSTAANSGAGSVPIALVVSGAGYAYVPAVIAPTPKGRPIGPVPGGVHNVDPIGKKKRRKPKLIGSKAAAPVTEQPAAPKLEAIYADDTRDIAALLRALPDEADNDDEEAMALILALVA
jgi:hypothetical protein